MYNVNQENRIFKTGFYLDEEGLAQGFKSHKGKLRLEHMSDTGYFFLQGYDSGEEEMTWNRICIKDSSDNNTKMNLYISTSEDPYVEFEGRQVELDEILQNPNIDAKIKIDLLLKNGAREYVNENDLLLYQFTGRYIWVVIKCYNVESITYELDEIDIEYPKQSFVDYFPQIYSEAGDFFERYIGIFQSLYMDIERQIDQVPHYLDIDTVPENFLNELGSWVGIDNSKEIFDSKQMRELIREAVKINGAKGTKATMERVVELYTGVKPIIVEYFKWNAMEVSNRERELYKKLYGKESNYFAVIINGTREEKKIDKNKLSILINEYKPAMSKYKLIILQRSSRSDEYCYLGVNSYLAEAKDYHLDKSIRLDGRSLLQLR